MALTLYQGPPSSALAPFKPLQQNGTLPPFHPAASPAPAIQIAVAQQPQLPLQVPSQVSPLHQAVDHPPGQLSRADHGMAPRIRGILSEEHARPEVDEVPVLAEAEKILWRELARVRTALTNAGALPSPSPEAIDISKSVLSKVPSEQGFPWNKADRLAVDTRPMHFDVWQFQSANFTTAGLKFEWEIFPKDTQAHLNTYKARGCRKDEWVNRSLFDGETKPHQIARITPENMRNIETEFFASGGRIDAGEYEYFEINIKDRVVHPVRLERLRFDFSRPSFWRAEDPHPRCINLSVFDRQYTEVAATFREQMSDSGASYDLVKIDTLQCDYRWEAYLLKKRQFLRDLGPTKLNEKMLWHGTTEANIAKIARSGFLRQFCNTHRFGKGVYFARDPEYSLSDRYSTPNVHGCKFLLLCKVLVGEYHEGSPGMKRPNQKTFDYTYQAYESTVDFMSNPSVFVTYQDDQAYPMYVLSLKPRH